MSSRRLKLTSYLIRTLIKTGGWYQTAIHQLFMMAYHIPNEWVGDHICSLVSRAGYYPLKLLRRCECFLCSDDEEE